MHKHVLGALAAVMVSLAGGPAWTQQAAQDQDNTSGLADSIASQKARLDRQDQLLRQQMQQLLQQQQALQSQQQQIDALQSQLGIVRPPPVVVKPAAVPVLLSPSELGSLRGTGQAADAQNDQAVGTPPAPPEKAPEVNLLSDRGGVLTKQGAFVYEPTIDFAHTTSNTAVISGFTIIPALTIGEIDISKQVLDVYQEVNTFRYGVTNHLELEARVPYVYGTEATTQRPLAQQAQAVTQFNTTGNSLGDIEAAVHYQVNDGLNGWPYFIGNIRFKTTTGTDPFSIPLNNVSGLPAKVATGSGFYAAEPSVTIIYPSDPAVLFANIGYIVNIPETKSLAAIGGTGSASVDPRSGPHLSVGLGFGINEASSFSLGFDYESFPAELIGGASQPGTALAVGSVLIGYSYKLNDRISFNLTTGIGTTADAPNTHVILRVPIQFQVFGDK
ncbi:MAG TPA: hypothetical protein VEI03_09290 [Stellaceae bacterium]|nr:hypothetical protein [Stellaceae bacterium]